MAFIMISEGIQFLAFLPCLVVFCQYIPTPTSLIQLQDHYSADPRGRRVVLRVVHPAGGTLGGHDSTAYKFIQ